MPIATPPRHDPAAVSREPRDARQCLTSALQRILEAEDFPALSRRMGELLGGFDGEEQSAQRVATYILRDFGLTLKVVRAANSLHYNRGRRPIRSVTQAMMLLGLQRVRELAMGLALFDHYGHRSERLRELLLLSLLTASHARETAMRVGLADPEAVQVCGMCHNIGEILVAAHFPAEYTEIGRLAEVIRRAPQGEHDVAPAGVVRQVLGFSYEELAEELMAHWGMPEEVRRTIRATGVPGENLTDVVTAFSHALSTAVYRIEADRKPVVPGEGAAMVYARFCDQLRLSREDARAVISAAAAEAREVFQDAGLPLDATPLAQRCTSALADLGDEEAASRLAVLIAPSAFVEAKAPSHGPPPLPVRAGTPTPLFVPAISVRGADGTLKPNAHVPAPDPTAVQRLRERLVADIEAAIPPETGGSLHDVMLTVLEALLRGAPMDRALFCLTSRQRGTLEARFGLGEGAESLVDAFKVPLDGTCAAVERALSRHDDVIVADGRGTPLAEARWVRTLNVQRVMLLPLVVHGVAIGVLYGDVRVDAPLSAATREFCGVVRDAAARAILARRDATPSGSPAVPTAVAPPAPAPAPEPPMSPEAALERRDVVLRLLRGASPQSLSAELGVPVETIAEWHRSFLEGALAGLKRS